MLELIHKFNKVTGYKINVQKSVAFLYTNNEATEREVKESIPFIIAPKPVRYLEINLTKEVEDTYSENYKTLRKKLKATHGNVKSFHARGIKGQVLLKYLNYPQQSTHLMQSLLKYQHFSQN